MHDLAAGILSTHALTAQIDSHRCGMRVSPMDRGMADTGGKHRGDNEAHHRNTTYGQQAQARMAKYNEKVFQASS